MKPADSQIRRELQRLRRIIETSRDPVERRVAQSMEEAIRWATEDTVGWTHPSATVRQYADMIRAERPVPV